MLVGAHEQGPAVADTADAGPPLPERPLGGDTDRDIAGEHRALLEATLDRDPARASTVLIDHIRRTSDVLLHNATAATGAAD